jgi:hypothetical protein
MPFFFCAPKKLARLIVSEARVCPLVLGFVMFQGFIQICVSWEIFNKRNKHVFPKYSHPSHDHHCQIEEETANRGLASAKHLSSFNTGRVDPFLLKCPLLWSLNNLFLNSGNGKSFLPCLKK